MTREKAKELLPVIQAWADGKEIQVATKSNPDNWLDMFPDEPLWDEISVYRIKPTPKLRPWRPEEVPVGALVKSAKPEKIPYFKYIITGVSGENGFVGSLGSYSEYSMEMFFVLYLHSTDNGKTWLPCGVEESV